MKSQLADGRQRLINADSYHCRRGISARPRRAGGAKAVITWSARSAYFAAFQVTDARPPGFSLTSLARLAHTPTRRFWSRDRHRALMASSEMTRAASMSRLAAPIILHTPQLPRRLDRRWVLMSLRLPSRARARPRAGVMPMPLTPSDTPATDDRTHAHRRQAEMSTEPWSRA